MRAAVLAILVVAIGTAHGDEKHEKIDKHKTHISKDGRYVVRIADPRPTTETRLVSTAQGPLKVTTEAFSRIRDVSLSVTYTDYPPAFETVDGAQLLVAVRKAMIQDGIPLDHAVTETKRGTRYGLEFRAKMTNSHEMRAKLFWTGRRLYQVVAIGKPKALDEPPIAEFLDRFELRD